ncbi:hypothetical protein [Streptacidiphilus rugosus]|uniref:hypothetical protein n=1 Tax=Streptacidiphilus rugosus TaxID=405783 RepID=UPI0005662BA7|nr:hypothetical protein [Streptacidiphilus rugosus]
MLNVDTVTVLSPADLANARIRALLAGASRRGLDADERLLYGRLVDEYLLARQRERLPVQIAVAA